ncbi:MAG: DUF5011 domain-containing protein, partial [bacterium]|nr:DUF5011 domain-containing protein [bacterium]
ATASDVGDGDLTGSIVIDAAAVDTATVGSYSVTYDVTDSQGNAAIQVTRTVDVVDTTAPIISLLGANPQTIEVGSAYVELGATANDDGDGDLTGSIVIDAAAVDTSVVGSYSVTYDVTDSQGNAATQVTRTVDVVDTTAPIISLLGANPQIIEVGDVYAELGATATDNYDGDLTGSIIINSSAVNTAAVGSYSVTYDVTDSEGNVATQVIRTVDVVDTTAPIITLLGANPQTIEAGNPYVELGATASDVGDGNLTGSIVIDATAVDTSVVGSYIVVYDVSDSSGNPATAFRTVDVVDTTPPVITLLGANPQVIQVGAVYSELGATALDSYDGDISGSVVINSSAVNTAVVGSYSVTYDVTDSEGNAAIQLTRTVDVVDTTIPVITLVGANPQAIDVGSPYVELGATATDNYDGDVSGSIATNSAAVNTAAVGSYSVTYDVTDSNGNAATQVVRTVNVVNAAPTLNAISDQTVAEGTVATFTATASDPDPTDTLTFSLSGAPAGASIDPVSGAFTWTPSEAQGPNTFVFDVVVSDGGVPALTDSQTVTFTVTEVNVAPSIGAIGAQSVAEQTTLSVPASVVDPDLPANVLAYSLAGSPPGATIDTSGVLTWTPTEVQGPGVYTFNVIVTDGLLGDIAPVTVTVDEVNVSPIIANPGAQSSAEDDVVALPIAASDSDIPSNTLTYSAIGLPPGLAIDPATGQVGGTMAFSASAGSPHAVTVFVADDGTPSQSGQTSFSWTVSDTNRNPVATADSVSVAEDASVTVDAIANDSDPDGDPVAVSSVGTPSHGTVSLAGTAIVYTPNPNYFGSDSFTYSLSDGRGGVAATTVAVTVTPVNDPPVLVAPATLSVVEHQEVAFSASAGDIEGDTVTFSIAGAPSGAAMDPSSGAFTWTPGESHGPGSYTFDVVATDDGSPVLATSRMVRITVAEANSAPVITNPGAQTSAENQPVSLAIVAIDPDIPADAIRFAAAGLPPGLAINPNTGVIAGTPPFDAAAGSPYAVTVTVSDDGTPEASSSSSFNWTVANTNRPPSATDLAVSATAGVPSSLFLTGTDPDGDTLSFAIESGPAKGVLTGGPRRFDYTAFATSSGTDQFTFTVSDGDAEATGTVTISITPNLPPVGHDDEYTVRRGGTLTVDAPGLLGNDRDPEGEPIGAVLSRPPAHGALTLRSDGSFVYTHDGDETELDVFTYILDDGMRTSVSFSVRILVEDNRAPVVVADSVTLDEDSTAVFHPLTNDYDPNDEPVSIASVSQPQNGAVEWRFDGALVYRPDKDWNGSDTFTYRITDGELTSSGSVTLRIRPVNDPPFASDAEVAGDSGDSVIIDLRDYVGDVDGDLLNFLVEQPLAGSIRELERGVFEIDLDGVIRDLGPLAFIVSDPDNSRATSLLRVVVRIPAELVGVPSLVSDDLDPS